MQIFKRIIIGVFLAGLTINPSSVGAADTINELPWKKTGIIPEKIELWGEKGQEIKQSLIIKNESEKEVIFSLTAENIVSMTDEGDAIFATAHDMTKGFDFAGWINFDHKDGIIQPGKNKVVNLTVKVPEYAEVGGKYVSIILSADFVDRPIGANTAGNKNACLILLTIAGGNIDKAEIEKFKVKTSTDDRKNTVFNIDAVIKNNGNSHIKPENTIVISRQGKKIASFPLDKEIILPRANRHYEQSFKLSGKADVGLYTATIAGTYGQSYQRLSDSSLFIIGSWPISILILLVLIVIFYFSFKIVKKILWKRKVIRK